MFVENRVDEFVKKDKLVLVTEENPVDFVTRGLTVPEIKIVVAWPHMVVICQI